MPDDRKKKTKPRIFPSAARTKSGDAVRKALTPDNRRAGIEKILKRNAGELPQIDREKLVSVRALRDDLKRFHGLKIPLPWFPWWRWRTPCSDKFGYMSSAAIRNSTKLPFNAATAGLLEQLGDFMGDPSRGAGPESTIPAGYTYFGQFVDHDITLDVASELDHEQDATKISNMRSPALDLDSVYGQGPAIDAFLYRFPTTSNPPTAVKLLIGTNQNFGEGGPGSGDGTGPMSVQLNSELPRAPSTYTALLGDPRNDENLIVSQFHHTMLKFHNQVVDGLVAAGFAGDVFLEAKRIVTHHYQWAVVHDFLGRICGQPAVNAAMSSVRATKGSDFSMPVEFAVGAYRFGHSMIREKYWINANVRTQPLSEVFAFIRNPRLPVRSDWVVDFNAFFETGFNVVVNHAQQIDSVLSPALDRLPGFSGLMAILAKRNLLRGLALGLPSGQGMAAQFDIAPMTAAQLKHELPEGEAALLDANGGVLLKKTPLWYYLLREAKVKGSRNQLGPVGGRIVAETFVRMLKRDSDSYLNASPAFTPALLSATAGDFTVADLVNFAGVTVP